MEKTSSVIDRDEHLPKIAVIAFPWQAYPPYKFLSDILEILDPLSESIILISGNTDRVVIKSKKVEVRDIGIGLHYANEINPRFYSLFLWGVKCFFVQILTVFELIKKRDDIEIVFFYMAYPYYIIPLITAKILKKKSIEVVTRSRPKSTPQKIISFFDPVFFCLLDTIALESPMLEKELNLQRFKKKLIFNAARFIDISKYRVLTKLDDREMVIGFAGRITKEKGIKDFVNAIPSIIKQMHIDYFLIIGKGDLLESIKQDCKEIEYKYDIKIIITGFIGESDVPLYLNKIKLLILPTNSEEGLPTIILEAMACGTPVLTTNIGAINDVISPGESGFFLLDNFPSTIADSSNKILSRKDLECISNSGLRKIHETYRYEMAVERYQLIINHALIDLTNDTE